MKKLLYFIPLLLLSCSKEDLEPEIQYSHVEIRDLTLMQYPNMNNPGYWDPNDWTNYQEPDVYLLVRNQDGAVFLSTSAHNNLSMSDLPVNWSWLYATHHPEYRDEIIFEVHDLDDGESTLMGTLSIHPFEVEIENNMAIFTETQNNITIAGTLYFVE